MCPLVSVLSIVAATIVWITHWVYRWRNPTCNGKLPPGSMGLPLIGETLQFFGRNSSFDIHPFFKHRMKRYGKLFKTSLVGWPVIVSTDPEFSHFIFQQEGTSVEFWYLDSFMKLLGQQKMTTSSGAIHKYLRNMVMDHFSPEKQKQKQKLLSDIENMARTNLQLWSNQESVDIKEVAATMSFGLGANKLCSYDQSKHSEVLIDKFTLFIKALISFPLNIPGTAFHKCLKEQKRGVAMLKRIVKERLDSTKKYYDFLDVVIEEMKKDEPLFNLESAAYFLFTILFTTFETVSLAITLTIKFISDHPSVLTSLTNEHEEILKQKGVKDSPLTWDDYKSMKFTSHVIDETLRLANIAPVICRRATRDILIDGYTIPKGWTIMVCPPTVHLNTEKYEDLLTFNPWRWEGQGSNTTSKNFMPFGGGM